MPLEEIIVGRDREDVKKYGKKGCVFLGKHVVGSKFEAHLTNPVLMDVTRPHVMMIVGKRGSGKSYTGAVIAENIMELEEDVRMNLSCLLIDTMGIFWSMKEPNDEALLLLKDWNMKPKGFPIQNVIPKGLKNFYDRAMIDYNGVYSLDPSELSVGDWSLTFGINILEPLGILLERTIRKLEGKYTINDIIETIEKDKRSTEKEKLALENRFLAAQGWGIFSSESISVEDLLKPGLATVFDVSLMDWNVRNLLVGLLARKIYEARMTARREEEISKISGRITKKIPMTWIVMDESHNFLPSDGKTSASSDLLRLVTQGRQPGISCAFITQRPNKLHETVIAQSDIVLSHMLTSRDDLDALGAIMQTYLLEDIRKSIINLPRKKGAAIILDDNSERMFNLQVRPRYSWHAGASPIAMSEK